jgi:hypothetical protein
VQLAEAGRGGAMRMQTTRRDMQAVAIFLDGHGTNMAYDAWCDCMREVYPAIAEECGKRKWLMREEMYARCFRLTCSGGWKALDIMEKFARDRLTSPPWIII